MASFSTYEYIKQSSISPELICTICTEILYQPVLTSCIHIFCRRCIERWLENGGNSCPICRHSLAIRNLIPVTKHSILNRITRPQDQHIKDGQNGIEPVSTAYCNTRLDREIALCTRNSTICLLEQKLTDQDMPIVVRQAIINKNCERLWLTKNDIGPDGTSVLAHALFGNKSLTELSLNNNHVSDIGVQYLVSILLLQNSSLRILSLSSNNLTDESAKHLATLLETNTTLTALWLSGNQISDIGVQLFADVLAHCNNTLQVLCLSSNIPVSDSTVNAIVDMAKSNQSLKGFYINSSALSLAIQTILQKLAKSKRRLICF